MESTSQISPANQLGSNLDPSVLAKLYQHSAPTGGPHIKKELPIVALAGCIFISVFVTLALVVTFGEFFFGAFIKGLDQTRDDVSAIKGKVEAIEKKSNEAYLASENLAQNIKNIQTQIEEGGSFASAPDEDLLCSSPINQYPIEQRYQKLGGLGALFTAKDCGSNRVEEMFGSDNTYARGSKLLLQKTPNEDTIKLLKTAGYSCADSSKVSAECVGWVLPSKPVDIDKLLPLLTEIDLIKKEACVECN